MKLCEAPNDTFLNVELYKDTFVRARKIGQCTYNGLDINGRRVNDQMYLLGICGASNDGFKYGTPISVIKETPDYFTDAVPCYINTEIFIPIEQIYKEFTSCRWRSDLNCELIIERNDQICNVCKISAPHKAPNQNEVFVCELCELQLSL